MATILPTPSGNGLRSSAQQMQAQSPDFTLGNMGGAGEQVFKFREDLDQGEKDLKRIDQFQEEQRKWRLASREAIDKSLTNWDNFKPDYKDDFRKRLVIRSVLESEAGFTSKDPTLYELARSQYGEMMAPGAGESDDAFFQAVQNRAQKAKSIKDAYESMTRHAGVATWTGENGGTYTFSDWWQKNSSNPEVAEKGIDVWRKAYRQQQEIFAKEYDDVLPEAREMWRILSSDEGYKSSDIKKLFDSMDFDERTRALGLLREAAMNIDSAEISGVIGNFFLQQDYAADDLASSTVTGLQKVLTDIAIGQGGVDQEKGAEIKKDLEAREIFAEEFRKILSEDYQPVTYQTPEGSFWGHIERGVFAAPAALATSAMAVAPIIGQVTMYSMMEQQAQTDLYFKMKQQALANGEEWTEGAHLAALNTSGAVAPIIGVGQALLERIGGQAILGKFPALDKMLTKFTDRMTNRALRFGTKATIIAGTETGIESMQNLWLSAVQDFTNALEEDMPDVNWGEVLKEEWAQSPTTFVAVLPLAIFGAAGGMSAERRAAAFAEASDADLYAFGGRKEDIEVLREAEGPAAKKKAMERFLQNRDPNSPEAKSFRRQKEKQEKRLKKLKREAEALGAVPAVRVTPGQDTYEVFDARTQLVYDTVATEKEAADMVYDLMNLKEKATQDRIDAFVAKIQGAREISTKGTEVQELVEGQVMTVAQARQEFKDLTERIERESELAEVAAGGSGNITKAVMRDQIIGGVSLPKGYRGAKEAINRLYAGSNIFTLIHEKSHSVRRELDRIGEFTRDEQVAFFQKLNDKFGDQKTKEVRDETGKVTKKARSIKFEGFDTDVVDDTALDEAWSHLAEVMLLRTRNGKKSNLRSLLNENLGKMIKANIPGAQKVGTFIAAMRKLFGLNLTRAEAIKRLERQGELDSAELDRISDVIMGNSTQKDYEGKAKREAKKLDPDNGNPTNAGISDEENEKRVGAFQVSHIDDFSGLEFEYLRDKSEFRDLLAKGFITTDRTIEDFDGMKMILHSPDSAFSGDIRKNGELLVEGKGGIFYPIKFHKDGYFWASTEGGAKPMVEQLNRLIKENGGRILMGLASAPIDKSLSSVTMANAVLDLFLAKANDRKFKLKKADVVEMIIEAANYKTPTGEGLGLNLKKSHNLDENLAAIRTQLKTKRKGETVGSTFKDRRAFSRRLVEELVLRVTGKVGAQATERTMTPVKNADQITHQLAELFSTGIQNEFFKGKTPSKDLKKYPDGFKRELSVKNVEQALGSMFAEPLLKPFQPGRGESGEPTGYIYAVLELDGPVELVKSDAHESYPFAVKSATGAKTKVHILQESEHWTNVINDPQTGRRVSERPKVPKLDEEGNQVFDKKGNPETESRLKKIFPTSGLTLSPVKVNTRGKPRDQSRSISLFADPPFGPAFSVTSADDAAYLAAVEQGDMDTAQEMVDDAAKKAGYDLGPVYHGSNRADKFTVFDPAKGNSFGGVNSIGVWFTTNKAQADKFAEFYEIEEDGKITGTNPGQTYSTYLNTGRVWEAGDLKNFFRVVLGRSGKSQLGEITAGDLPAIREYFANSNIDAVKIADTSGDDLTGTGDPGVYYLTFSSNQIKSADPVTYDESGNVIPLSQRFNEQDDRISFSITEPTREELDMILPGATYVGPDELFDSKIEGPVVVGAYHGSTHHIDRFTSERANLLNDMGVGIYATTSLDDVNSNYAGRGPDLTNRIEMRQEELEQLIQDQIDEDGITDVAADLYSKTGDPAFLSDELLEADDAAERMAVALAQNELEGKGGGRIYPLLIPMSNPAVIADGKWGEGGTYYDPRATVDLEEIEEFRKDAIEEIKDDYGLETDEELEDYQAEVEARMIELADVASPLVEAIYATSMELEIDDPASILEAVQDYQLEGGNLAEIVQDISEAVGDLDPMTANGEMVGPGEFIHRMLRHMGYDGIIDKTVYSKFPTMNGVTEDTVHVVVDPEATLRPRSAIDKQGPAFSVDESGLIDPNLEKKARERKRRASLRMKMTRAQIIEAIEGSKDWKDFYTRAREYLTDLFREDTPMFERILSATSQAASVSSNVALALKAYGQLKRGEEFQGYLPAVIKNLEKIRDDKELGGRKIGNYEAANKGDESKVVVDRHVARMLFGVVSPTPAQFTKAEKVLTEVAQKIGWQPREVQAAIWAASIRKSGKEPESYDGRLKTIEEQGTLEERIGFAPPGRAGNQGGRSDRGSPTQGSGEQAQRGAFSVQDPELIDPLIMDLRNRIKSPEAQLMLLSDLSKRLDRVRLDLDDMTLEQEARQKRAARRVDLQDELTGLREELAALDQAYDYDLEQLTEEHEANMEQIGEDITAQFSHRIEAAKASAKKGLEREAKAREAERRKAERDRFAEAKKMAQEKIKNERLELENQIGKLEGQDQDLEARQEREDVIDAIATLDTILMALPPELRGKVGGFAQISKLRTDQQRIDFIGKRLEKMDQVVERYLKTRYQKMMKKFLKRTRPKQGEAGKGKRGQAGGMVHEVFEYLEKQVMGMSAEDIDAELVKIDKKLNSATPLAIDEETKWRTLGDLVPLFGDWKNADSHRMEAALRNGQVVYDEGYLSRLIEVTRRRELAERRAKRLQAESGKAGSAIERDKQAQVDTQVKSLPRRTMLSLLSFDQLLTYTFGKKSKIAAMFANKERNASAQKEDELAETFDDFSDLFTQIAGSELEGEKLRYRMAQKSIETKNIKRNLSEAEAIQALMMWDQEDGRRHMKGPRDENGRPIPGKWAYSQAFIDELEAAISPEAKRVRAYLRKSYDAEYESLNAIHEALYGISLPRHKLYAPLTVTPAVASDSGTIDPVSGMEASAISTTFGSLKTRSSIAVAEPKFTDAFQVFLGHKKQMAHWKAYAPLVQEMRAVFSGRDLGNSIEAAVGKEGLTVIRKWIDLFATGGVRDASMQLALNQTINRMTGRAAGATLIGRFSVLIIQATQLGAALAKMPTTAYLRGMGKLFTGQLNWGATIKSDYIQRRIESQPPVVRQALDALAASKPSMMKYIVTKLGETISGADALFTAGTHAIIYDHQLRLAKKQGMAEADAEVYAREQAERLTDDVAQPTRAGARSLYENTTQGSPGFRLLWAFASEPRQKLALAAYNIATGTPAEKARALAVTWGFGGAVAAIIRAIVGDMRSDDDEEWFDDRHWNPTKLALQALTGPLQGIPILGDLLEGAVFTAAGEYLPEGNLFSSGEMAVKGGINLATLKSFEEDGDLMRDVDGLLTGAGLFWDSAAAASSLSHLAKDLFSLGSNLAK